MDFSNMKKVIILTIITLAALIGTGGYLHAQEQQNKVTYPDGLVIDSDLDGLTDQGEIQIYHTDPKNPDTDGDGVYDGTEVISHSDPLAPPSVAVEAVMNSLEQQQIYPTEAETPWAWYVVRASGLIGFLLLYIAIFLGLAIRLPLVNRVIKPVYSSSVHCWLSLQALLFALVHGVTLIFDKFANFSLLSVLVPFAYQRTGNIEPGMVALGIVGFYLMLILVVTSYARRFMSHAMWRAVHFTNIALYIVVIIHALALGTDLANPVFRDWFVFANEALIALMVVSMALRIKRKPKTNIVSKPPIPPVAPSVSQLSR